MNDENPVPDEREEVVDQEGVAEDEDQTLFDSFLDLLQRMGPLATAAIFFLCMAASVVMGMIIMNNVYQNNNELELLLKSSPLQRDPRPLPDKKPRYPRPIDLHHPENQEV